MAPPDPDRLYEIAYDEAVRALAEQQAAIESLRSRAGLFLSAAAITTSFLGARAVGLNGFGLASWLATGSFIGVALLSFLVLWPRDWELTADPRGLISGYIEAEEPAMVETLYRDLALHMHASYAENEKGLEQLVVCSQAAISLLAGEVVFWILALTLPL